MEIAYEIEVRRVSYISIQWMTFDVVGASSIPKCHVVHS
jgi:hypothetical protein